MIHEKEARLMSDLTVIQQAAVADHLADLAREGAALRAERVRDHVRGHATEADEALTHAAHPPSTRMRLGRWLIAVGEAIGGSADQAPADDAPERLQPAA